MVCVNRRLIEDNPGLFDLTKFIKNDDPAATGVHTYELSEHWKFEYVRIITQSESDPTPYYADERHIDTIARTTGRRLVTLFNSVNMIADHLVAQPFRWHVPLVSTGVMLDHQSFEPKARFATRYAYKVSL